MNNEERYNQIKKLVIEDLTYQAKLWHKSSVKNWEGDAYVTPYKRKKMEANREKLIKGSKMLLEAFKLLGYK